MRAAESSDEKERVNHQTAMASGHFIECHAGLGSRSIIASLKDTNQQCPLKEKIQRCLFFTFELLNIVLEPRMRWLEQRHATSALRSWTKYGNIIDRNLLLYLSTYTYIRRESEYVWGGGGRIRQVEERFPF